jgi:uroporphyrinogen decarboxylase
MTAKERMLRALHLEKPDRLPATIHQWQKYHLDKYLGGMDALEAFKLCGLDASIQYFEPMGQFWITDGPRWVVHSPQWVEDIQVVRSNPDDLVLRHTITTPGGQLHYRTGANRMTTWLTEYLIKTEQDLGLIEKYMPVGKLNLKAIAAEYDRVGEHGILRGFVWGDQAGCWQHACCLMPVEDLILKCVDNPGWVHRLLGALLERKLRFIEQSLASARFDVVETGGGAASDTVISPKLHREFCLPYDRCMHEALHRAGQRATYHTCGGMMHILDLILENGTDASETLSPPGVGGTITDPHQVRSKFARKVAMIGGMDQFHILGDGTAEDVRAEVKRLAEGFGKDGGYICSAADHFFEVPVENLKAFAAAARECAY